MHFLGARRCRPTSSQSGLSDVRDLLCSVLAGAHAIGDAYAAIGIAGERETTELLAEALDTVEAVEMADAVLRHGRFPFVDACEKGRGANAKDLLQFGADDSGDGVVGKLPNVFRGRSGEEAAQ